MTDVPSAGTSVPGRLGVTGRLEQGELVLELAPRPEVLHHGCVRVSVLAFMVDAVAGVSVDTEPDLWTLTSDMSVRMRPVRAPRLITATNVVRRLGRRSVTCTVELTSDQGLPVASGAIGFVKIPRRETDPPKPSVPAETSGELFGGQAVLSRPLREEAGIESVDPAAGVVEVKVGPELRNPAGTIQGAMVALLAEAAAEDLLSSRFGRPFVVVDLDLRYLAQAQVGPVATRCRLLGEGPEAPVEVELHDTAASRVTTLVYARALPAPD